MFWSLLIFGIPHRFDDIFQEVKQEPFELEPVEIEEVFEQCNPDIHNGCQISTNIEEYSYEYQIEDVILVGKMVKSHCCVLVDK